MIDFGILTFSDRAQFTRTIPSRLIPTQIISHPIKSHPIKSHLLQLPPNCYQLKSLPPNKLLPHQFRPESFSTRTIPI